MGTTNIQPCLQSKIKNFEKKSDIFYISLDLLSDYDQFKDM